MATPSFERVAPVLPVRDVAAALAHYRRLGFSADAYEEAGPHGPIYGFLCRGSVELHLALVRDLDPKTNTSACYVYVSDAKGLHEAWCSAGVAGHFTSPEDTPYGLCEFAHVDPDGNLLRVGSPLPKRGGP
jgi:hypothetical protein